MLKSYLFDQSMTSLASSPIAAGAKNNRCGLVYRGHSVPSVRDVPTGLWRFYFLGPLMDTGHVAGDEHVITPKTRIACCIVVFQVESPIAYRRRVIEHQVPCAAA